MREARFGSLGVLPIRPPGNERVLGAFDPLDLTMKGLEKFHCDIATVGTDLSILRQRGAEALRLHADNSTTDTQG